MYERLVSYPEETLRDIGIYLNENFSSTHLKLINAPEFSEKHGRLRPNYIGHYSNILTKSDIAFIQSLSKRLMLANGYELETFKFSVNKNMVTNFRRRIDDFTRFIGWMVLQTLRQKFPGRLSPKIALEKIQLVSSASSDCFDEYGQLN